MKTASKYTARRRTAKGTAREYGIGEMILRSLEARRFGSTEATSGRDPLAFLQSAQGILCRPEVAAKIARMLSSMPNADSEDKLHKALQAIPEIIAEEMPSLFKAKKLDPQVATIFFVARELSHAISLVVERVEELIEQNDLESDSLDPRSRSRPNDEMVVTAISDTPPSIPALRATPGALVDLVRQGFSDDEIAAFVVSKRTLARRRADDEPLTVEETDKALRLKRIGALAQRVFGDPTKAHRWLRKPKRSLAQKTPLAFLASEAGARLVEEMLHRIEFGMFA